jgi:hypothetical protein
MTAFVRTVVGLAALVAVTLTLGADRGHGQASTTLKIQAAWPPTSYLWESFKFFAERVEKVSGGR